MKRNLLSVALAASFNLTLAQTNPFTPPSGTLPAHTAGTPYSTEITFTIPATVQIDPASFGQQLPVPVPPFDANVDTVRFTVTGLPAGLAATFNNGTGIYYPNQSGTLTISGTPTTSAGSVVNIISETSGSGVIAFPGFPPVIPAMDIPITFPGALTLPVGGSFDVPRAPGAMDGGPYTMGTVSVQELNLSKFDVIQNTPNPFSGNTTIKFSTPVACNIDFVVFDMIGKRVHSEKIQAQAKSNSIIFNGEKLASGTYFYSLSNGTKTITKKMVVAGK